MSLSKPIHFGDGVSNRLRTWLMTLCNRMFYMEEYDISLTIPVLSANSSTDESVTVTGVKTDDVACIVTWTTTLPSGIVDGAFRITADDTVSIRFANAGTGSSSSKELTGNLLVFKRK